MAAADRRRAILNAVIPLLIEKGASLTTAEMAEAAGIAEGTIFRVFPDKSALIYEAVKATMDPHAVAAAIDAIDPSTPLRAQLREAAAVLLDHFNRGIALAELLRSMPVVHGAARCDVRRLITEANAVISAALSELFERHGEVLRLPPPKAIAALRGLIFASGHPLLPPGERLTIDEVVAVLLSGVTRRDLH
jgi:AcrR family transcriptional regulator